MIPEQAFILFVLVLCMFYTTKRMMDAAYDKDMRLFAAYFIWQFFLLFTLIYLFS